MGHVVIAAPSIERIWLHEQVGRALMRRGHRVTVLATDPATLRCYDLHGLPTRPLRPLRGSRAPQETPLEEFAARDLQARGQRATLEALRAQRARLERFVEPLVRFFETRGADLVLFHGRRDGRARLAHFIARRFGAEVVHTGPGLIGGTTQVDPEGVDGDALACRRGAGFYRSRGVDRSLLDSVLASVLGGAKTPPLPPRIALLPDLLDRAAVRIDGLRLGQLAETRTQLARWNGLTHEAPAATTPQRFAPPHAPFVTVLLQHPNDLRLRLDAPESPTPAEFATAAQDAAHAIDPDLAIVLAPPITGVGLDALRGRDDGFVTCPPDDRTAAAAAAAAVITINDPDAMTAIVAGTPVVHLGTTPYGVPGVSSRASGLNELGDALRRAMRTDTRTLRARFATQVLTNDHVWCDPAAPDPNGLRGLVADLEHRLQRSSKTPEPLSYAPGPMGI